MSIPATPGQTVTADMAGVVGVLYAGELRDGDETLTTVVTIAPVLDATGLPLPAFTVSFVAPAALPVTLHVTGSDGSVGVPQLVYAGVADYAPTAALATVSEFALHIGRDTLTTTERARAEYLLDSATATVQGYARQTIGLVTDDVLTRTGSVYTEITLPERPVVSVLSVVLGGVALVEGTDFTVSNDRPLRATGWGSPSDTLVITYTHGYDPVPGLLRNIVVTAAARVWHNPAGVVTQALGASSTTFAIGAPSGVMLTDDEKRNIRRIFGGGGYQSIPLHIGEP